MLATRPSHFSFEYSTWVIWKDKEVSEIIMVSEIANQIIKLSREFPNAEFILEGETYNDEDAIIP
ncbi:MAG: hypothetical protein ACE5PV_08735 [Candidatus Poribacteria bacterium]